MDGAHSTVPTTLKILRRVKCGHGSQQPNGASNRPTAKRKQPAPDGEGRDHHDLYPKEAARLAAAQATLHKIQRLPRSWPKKARFIPTAALPKASYGWLHHMPPAIFCRRLRVDAFKALGAPTTCDRSLTRLFMGHNTDIAFMIGYSHATAYHKLQQTATHNHQRRRKPPT